MRVNVAPCVIQKGSGGSTYEATVFSSDGLQWTVYPARTSFYHADGRRIDHKTPAFGEDTAAWTRVVVVCWGLTTASIDYPFDCRVARDKLRSITKNKGTPATIGPPAIPQNIGTLSGVTCYVTCDFYPATSNSRWQEFRVSNFQQMRGYIDAAACNLFPMQRLIPISHGTPGATQTGRIAVRLEEVGLVDSYVTWLNGAIQRGSYIPTSLLYLSTVPPPVQRSAVETTRLLQRRPKITLDA